MDPLHQSRTPRTKTLHVLVLTSLLMFTNCSTNGKKTVAKVEDKGPHTPKVFMPGASCDTVKEKIDGRRWEQAHIVCTLKDAVWSPE